MTAEPSRDVAGSAGSRYGSSIPVVALIGRPNVGKSALFNRIVGENTAIVSEEAGTTRDRHFARTDWAGRNFWLVDTGGVSDDPRAPMELEIRRQVDEAIGEADLLLFVVDAHTTGSTLVFIDPLEITLRKFLEQSHALYGFGDKRRHLARRGIIYQVLHIIGVLPARVRVEMNDGRCFSQTIADLPGSGEAPLSADELRSKALSCLGQFGGRAERIITAIDRLEEIDDLSRIFS